MIQKCTMRAAIRAKEDTNHIKFRMKTHYVFALSEVGKRGERLHD